VAGTVRPVEDQVMDLGRDVEVAVLDLARDIADRIAHAMPIVTSELSKMVDATFDYLTTMAGLRRHMTARVVHALRAPAPVPAKKETPRVARAA